MSLLFQQMSHLLGTANLWASLTPVVLTYLFYSSFDSRNPEGRVTDTTVMTAIIHFFDKLVDLLITVCDSPLCLVFVIREVKSCFTVMAIVKCLHCCVLEGNVSP